MFELLNPASLSEDAVAELRTRINKLLTPYTLPEVYRLCPPVDGVDILTLNLRIGEKSHEIDVDEMAKLISRKPEIVVVGTGQSGCVKVMEDARYLAVTSKIRILAIETEKALEVFNAFIKDGKKTVAVIHVTC